MMSDELLKGYYRVVDHLSAGDTTDETLATVVDFATTLLHGDECCTYVRQGEELVPWVWKHVDCASLERIAIPVDRGWTAVLAANRAPIAIQNEPSRYFTFKMFDQWSKFPGESFISVPFLSRFQLEGAMTIHHWQPRSYSRVEYRALSSLGYLLGGDLAIDRLERGNSELVVELETRKLVERGKGILQRDLGMSEHEALLALQQQSEEKNRPLKEIAQAIILSAEVKQSVFQTD